MTINDPALYRELSVPHASKDAALAEAEAFMKGVEALRKQHRVANLYLIGQMPVMASDDSGPFESEIQWTTHFGSSEQALPMLARAFGGEEAQYADRIARLRADSKNRRKI